MKHHTSGKDSSNKNYNVKGNNELTSFLGGMENKSSDIKEVSGKLYQI
jgi:hypothetical protein